VSRPIFRVAIRFPSVPFFRKEHSRPQLNNGRADVRSLRVIHARLHAVLALSSCAPRGYAAARNGTPSADEYGDRRMIMQRFGMVLGLLLAVIGITGVVTLMLGVGADTASFTPGGEQTSRAPFAIAAGLALAAGLTLLGLNAGHWRRPVPPGPELDRTPDRGAPGTMR
jgi:hypothetical protein